MPTTPRPGLQVERVGAGEVGRAHAIVTAAGAALAVPMAEVEARARAAGARAVRFAAATANESLVALYRRGGYVERGGHQIAALPVTCFEKELP